LAEALLRCGGAADALDGAEGGSTARIDHHGRVQPGLLEQRYPRERLSRKGHHAHHDAAVAAAVAEIHDKGGVVERLGREGGSRCQQEQRQ
jgi:hypothetical protein